MIRDRDEIHAVVDRALDDLRRAITKIAIGCFGLGLLMGGFLVWLMMK